MRRNKSSFEEITSSGEVSHNGKFESLLGTLMIVPVTIHKEVEIRLGTLLVFSTFYWKVSKKFWGEIGKNGNNGIQSVLMPNLNIHRTEESEEDAVERIKQMIISSMEPNPFFKDWEKTPWQSGTLYTPSSKIVNANLQEDGLAS
jgi:hypothetical protein